MFYRMKYLGIILLVIISVCVLPTLSRSRTWQRHYNRMRENARNLEIPIDVCYFQRWWTHFVVDAPAPRCSNFFHYEPWQTNSKYRWCADRHGIPIDYTLELIQSFPYECRKTRECPKGTVRETTKRCDATCEEAQLVGFKTRFDCKRLCICPRGMYRNVEDECVWLEDCPKLKPCEPPMEYTRCASKCPLTCATQKHTCDYSCAEGVQCVCPKGMILMSKYSERCVKPSDCPKCDYGSLPTDCAPACPDTCPGNGECKAEGCETGAYCVCEPGKIRLDRKLPVKCVLPDECPPVCEEPRVPKGCGTACPPTCDDPNPQCTEQCVPENICSCPDGYLQRSKEDRTCVKRSECIQCKSPAVPVVCKSTCPLSCEPRGFFCSRKCTFEYVCGCPDGYVQLASGSENVECVEEKDCPAKCPAPKVYQNCPVMCRPTCQDPKPGSCKRGCNAEKCVCPDGMVQPDKDTLECIMPEDCPAVCEPPKVAKGCGTACPATCDDPEPICTQQCTPENICSCPDGYVQRSRTDTACVKLAECFNCPAPGIHMKCEPACPESCEGRPIFCRRECPSKYVCGCPDGYVLLKRDGKECVKREDCPPKCPPPQKYATCASLCPPTCQNPRPASCRRGCSSQNCICPEGMVQPDEDTLTCMKPSDCPQECSPPKEYRVCPSMCQPTCADPTPDQSSCASGCGDDKCVCPKGFVLLSDEDKSCVKVSQCPKQCTFPEVLFDCRSTCVATCDNLETLDASDCALECDSSDGGFCGCADGYVRRSQSDSTCVKVSACPPRPTKSGHCEFPKVYADCPSKCPRTCADPKPAACSRGCDPNVVCICSPGYVQRDKKNKTCIKLEDCPVCKAPKVYTECASKCRPNCQNPNPIFCDLSCDTDVNCVCPPGMVHPKNGDSDCIPLKECPESCGYPTIPTNCASTCPPTCDDPVPKCDKGKCKEGVKCVCPIGFLQRSSTNSTCLLPTQCPGLPKDCPLRKIPTRCATGCPATCQNREQWGCTKPCRPDVNCECPRGMLQRSLQDDTCLWPYQCED